MSDFTIYIFLLLLVVCFWAWELWVSKRSRRSLSHDSTDVLYEDDDNNDHLNNPGLNTDNKVIIKTLRVLGPERYGEMTKRLSSLMDKHKGEEFYTVSLEAVSLGKDCARVLHHLLPGDPLCLLRSENDGNMQFKVFSEGHLVGGISSENAVQLSRLMKYAYLSGIYVWRQNCYGCTCEDTNLDIIVFYSFKEKMTVVKESLFDDIPFVMRVEGVNPFILIQN